MKIKVCDRYLFQTFIKYFLLSLFLCGGLVLFSRGLEMSSPLGKHDAPVSEFILYIIFEIPWVLREVMPTTILLASFFCYGILKRNSEITALSGGGVGMWNITRSIFTAVIILIMVQVSAEEWILPYTTFQSRVHKNVVRGREPTPKQIGNIIIRISPVAALQISSLDIERKKMVLPRYTELDNNGNIYSSIDGYVAVWDDDRGVWEANNVIVRRFGTEASENILTEEKYERYALPIDLNFEEILISIKSQRGAGENYYPEFVGGEGASISDILHAMRLNRKVDITQNPLKTTLFYKLLFPFNNIILFMIGMIVAMRVGRTSTLHTNFGIAILLSFIYWGTVQILRTLGSGGTIPPWSAVVLPPLPMIFFGWYFLRKI